ncbi:MAG: DNA replication/repair protein RecF [Gammaproteobacteria bacterium]|nr:DNA replication/repair protein RecF [Gammaproteobacteria bacterium]
MLKSIQIQDFRCIESARLELDPQLSVILGRNAAGKTSLLEALFFLGRGRSFRPGTNQALIRRGAPGFLLVGEQAADERLTRVGVEYTASGFRVKIGGEERLRLADLANWVPAAVIDPEVHELVQGPPEQRRRFIDWGVFHVEQGFADTWRRYQRLLRQRNSALRSGVEASALAPWTQALAEAGTVIGAMRDGYVRALAPRVAELAQTLAGLRVELRHLQGWAKSRDLGSALEEGVARELAAGVTLHGPHRGDLALEIEQRAGRAQVSRGQQKLLAASLVLAQLALFAENADQPPLLLLDDPAAELDDEAQARLLAAAWATPAQRVVTGLRATGVTESLPHALFHVEQGKVTQVL